LCLCFLYDDRLTDNQSVEYHSSSTQFSLFGRLVALSNLAVFFIWDIVVHDSRQMNANQFNPANLIVKNQAIIRVFTQANVLLLISLYYLLHRLTLNSTSRTTRL
jgi:hypothetical protein